MSCNMIQIARAIAGAFENINPPTRSQIRFLGHYNEAASATLSTDFQSRKHVLRNGAAFSPDSARFGSAGVALNGGTLYLDMNTADYLTGDFTIEFWIKFTSLASASNVRGVFDLAGVSGDASFGLGFRASGTPILRHSGAAIDNGVTEKITTGTWNHIAVTRLNNVITVWVNGVSAGTALSAAGVRMSGNGFTIGYMSSVGQYSGGGVSIDELRYVVGHAVYTGPFTPQTFEFPTPA